MKKYILPTLTVLAVALGIVIGVSLSQKANAQRIVYQNGTWQFEQTKIDRLLQLMETAYVDSLNIDSITDEVMTELVKKLDPHSAYIPKEDLEMVNSELAGSFSGIGVQFTIQQDTVRIVAVIAGGPSEGVGVLAGDKLITVDDSLFVGKKINNEKVMRTLRGEKGTQVKIGVLRAGTPDMLYFTISSSSRAKGRRSVSYGLTNSARPPIASSSRLWRNCAHRELPVISSTCARTPADIWTKRSVWRMSSSGAAI